MTGAASTVEPARSEHKVAGPVCHCPKPDLRRVGKIMFEPTPWVTVGPIDHCGVRMEHGREIQTFRCATRSCRGWEDRVVTTELIRCPRCRYRQVLNK